ncbi:hypothetical protein Hanom_Chr00s000002g01600601 [Helianthus anomalus]
MLQKELLLVEITAQKERTKIMEGAKLSATIAMLKIKMHMAKEQRLTELGDEDEPEEVLALVGGGNEVKDPTEEAAGGSGKGGEEKFDDAAKV